MRSVATQFPVWLALTHAPDGDIVFFEMDGQAAELGQHRSRTPLVIIDSFVIIKSFSFKWIVSSLLINCCLMKNQDLRYWWSNK